MCSSKRDIRIGDRIFSAYHLGDDDPYAPAVSDDYDLSLQKFARDHISDSSIVLDVGANIGLTSFIFSGWAKTVHSFEPNPSVFPLLAKNVAANNLTNVHCHQMAVGASSGSTRFTGTSAFGHISRDGSGEEVVMTHIDKAVHDLGIAKVDVIKIDVEGFEPSVLEGARETIQRDRPVIYMEINSICLMRNGRFNPFDFLEQLHHDFGRIQIVRPDGLHEAPDANNLICDNLLVYGSVNDIVLSEPLAAQGSQGLAQRAVGAVRRTFGRAS